MYVLYVAYVHTCMYCSVWIVSIVLCVLYYMVLSCMHGCMHGCIVFYCIACIALCVLCCMCVCIVCVYLLYACVYVCTVCMYVYVCTVCTVCTVCVVCMYEFDNGTWINKPTTHARLIIPLSIFNTIIVINKHDAWDAIRGGWHTYQTLTHAR